MYKITVDGKTMVGCNQDAWRKTTSIWFVNSKNDSEYGACFTGSRKLGPNQFAPQSGMNVEGLTFSRLAAYHPIKNQEQIEKKQITGEVEYLTDILQKCKTIEEVRNFINKYDYSIYIDEVFIYIDKSGDYLIVEPYQMINGNDSTYVLANFCPSFTSHQDASRQARYKDGYDYLRSNTLDASLEFCRSVSDTMSVCRNRNGDGTLLTSIWDTQDGLVNLYFYHDYDKTIQFNISEELALGNHSISIPEQFPKNAEFQRLLDYKTPFNVPALRLVFAIIGVFILVLSLLFFVSYFLKRNRDQFNMIKLAFAGLNIPIFAYLFILATNINIYYFDAPYQHYSSQLISLSSFIPFILLLIIVPISYYNLRFLKSNTKAFFVKSSLVANNAIYFMLLIGFVYWGLFDVLN